MITLYELFYDNINMLIRKLEDMESITQKDLEKYKAKKEKIDDDLSTEFRERCCLSRAGAIGLRDELYIKEKVFSKSSIVMDTFFEYNYLSNKLEYLEDLLDNVFDHMEIIDNE